MGTTWSIRLAGAPSNLDQRALRSQVRRRLDELEQAMSTYRDDSEVSRFNASPTTNWFAVSRDVALVVAEAQRVSQITGGAFDITAGPLVELWGFGRTRHARVPTREDIHQALARVGWQRLSVRLNPPSVRKAEPDMAIDLSGIAKGYAVDAVVALLQSQRLTNCLVQIGGETRACGVNPAGASWRVGIATPAAHARTLERVVELRDQALATSGDYRNHRVVDGRRIGHLFDPRTGQPVTNDAASVSVLAGSCMTADALATALCVLGTERGLAVAEARGAAGLFLLRDGRRLVFGHAEGSGIGDR